MTPTGNRIVTFEKPLEMKVNTFKFPELITPQGKSAPHGAILKIVTTNICGSDLHIYRGSFAVPKGMTMGHEMTGEVIEVGSDVEVVKKGDIVSVPFNVGCGRCYNCKHMRSDVCENTTGHREVDRVIDYVGVDCRGFGAEADKIVESAVTNAMLKYVRFGGMTSTVGVYCANPISKDPKAKKGHMDLEWSNAWIKSPRMSAGQSPTANYNHALMRAILNDRMPYLSPMMNTKFIKLEDAPAAYKEFDAGSAYKYVIDPHGSVPGSPGVVPASGHRTVNPALAHSARSFQ